MTTTPSAPAGASDVPVLARGFAMLANIRSATQRALELADLPLESPSQVADVFREMHTQLADVTAQARSLRDMFGEPIRELDHIEAIERMRETFEAGLVSTTFTTDLQTCIASAISEGTIDAAQADALTEAIIGTMASDGTPPKSDNDAALDRALKVLKWLVTPMSNIAGKDGFGQNDRRQQVRAFLLHDRTICDVAQFLGYVVPPGGSDASQRDEVTP